MSPAFSPNGTSVFFSRSNGSVSTILVSSLKDGQWTAPVIAPFSGVWNDLEPTMAPDGSFLVFASNRPAEGKTPLDGTFNGKTFTAKGGNLWRVERVGSGWGKPERLPGTINANSATFSPSISADGSIYFMKPDDRTGRFHLFRSQYSSGTYLPATRVEIGDDTTEDVDPAVAPDETFVIYSSNQPSSGKPKRLQIAFREADGWGKPVDLGDEVNEQGGNIEARLSPDHQVLYFSTNTVPPVSFPQPLHDTEQELLSMNIWANGRHNIWFVSLKPWLKERTSASKGAATRKKAAQ